MADATGEQAKEVLPVSGGIHAHWPAWSADGQHIYFNYGVNSTNLGPTEIWRVAVAGGPGERVIATSRRTVYPCPTPDARGVLYSSNPIGVADGSQIVYAAPCGSPSRTLRGEG